MVEVSTGGVHIHTPAHLPTHVLQHRNQKKPTAQAFGMMAPGLSSAYWQHVEAFLALPEAEQRAAKRRLLTLQQEEQEREEEGGRRRHHGVRKNATAATAAVSGEDGSSSSSSNGNDPRLLLLVPARSVEWGNGQGGQQHAYEQQQGEAWLEVGCRLTSMRLVNDVRFPAAV